MSFLLDFFRWIDDFTLSPSPSVDSGRSMLLRTGFVFVFGVEVALPCDDDGMGCGLVMLFEAWNE
ncbi:hypothetical protein ACHAXS_013760 [Conticribra weissflogii]